MTIYAEFGILIDPEAFISTSDLNSIVHTMRSEQVGETIVRGHLRSLGYRVTRERVPCVRLIL